jgi:TM2 domain-containing membrane protein YozV
MIENQLNCFKTMANIYNYLPELEPGEMAYLQPYFQNLTHEQAQQFTSFYRARRRDPLMILLAAMLGLIFVAGVHRLLIGDIGLGILYFFTGGLCFIGTIVDMINYRRLATDYNLKEARYVQAIMAGQFGAEPPPYAL